MRPTWVHVPTGGGMVSYEDEHHRQDEQLADDDGEPDGSTAPEDAAGTDLNPAIEPEE